MSIRNYKPVVLIIFVLLFPASIIAQPYQRILNPFPVSDPEGMLKNIFSGGHNNPEFQFVDIDNDGDYDLIYLESDATFGWYENQGNAGSPDYILSLNDNLPGLQLYEWFFFLDIDNDQDYDYFTANGDRMSYYENTGSVSSPNFVLAVDTVLDDLGQSIYSEAGCNPVFADVDGDGDYDFISGNTIGTLTYYENIGNQQSYNFKFITNFWQDILIIGTNPGRHGASSLDFVDINNDNDLDLFWGDFFSNSLYYIENQGTISNPDLNVVSTVYPINADSVNTSGFNMPRFIDIDNDQDYDLFVSVLYDQTVKESIMYYKNNGSVQNADLHLVTKDFLKTLDAGTVSIPVFCDIDADGDQDLFIGSFNNPSGSIHFLRNSGTVSNPEFFYEDSAFANIFSELSLTAAFGDLDSDNDYDLITGKLDGKLNLYLNTGTPATPQFLSGTPLMDNTGTVIDVGTSAVPFLFDVDNDNDMDLVIGGFDGKVRLYENTGTSSSAQFTLNSSYFNSIDVGDNSVPFLIDYNKDGLVDLFIGNRLGNLFYYKNTGTNSQPVWDLQTDNFINPVNGYNTAPWFIDIDNDTDYDLILGNVKGGLYFYNNTSITNVAGEETLPKSYDLVEAFPNPFNPYLNIVVNLNENSLLDITIYNIIGERVKEVFSGDINSGIHQFIWNGTDNSGSILPSGSYIVLVRTQSNKQALKVTFLK